MLRRIISIPEGVYYRGRFRATTAWSKASKREGDNSTAVPDEEMTHTMDEPERAPRERAISGKTKVSVSLMKPAGSFRV